MFALRRRSFGMVASYLFACMMLFVVVGTPLRSADAAITGVSPGSATVESGEQRTVSTTATSDVGGVSASASSPLTVVSVQQGCTSCQVNVRVSASAAPGSYSVGIFDAGGGSGSFTVI